jgi:hypothetical protein
MLDALYDLKSKSHSRPRIGTGMAKTISGKEWLSHPLASDVSEPKFGCGTREVAQYFTYGCRNARKAMDENCRRINNLLDLYRAGRLTEEEKADVEYHLLYCPECMFLLTLVPSLNSD